MADIFGEGAVVLYVNGTITECIALDTLHGVDNPIGDCSFTVPRPLPANIGTVAGAVGKRVEVFGLFSTWTGMSGGLRTGLSQDFGLIFRGVIADGGTDYSADAGPVARFTARDELYRLEHPDYEDRAWQPATPTSSILADTIFRGYMTKFGYGTASTPPYHLDALRFPDGSALRLGGIPEIDDGQVILKAGRSPLTFLREMAETCGYRFFGLPTGAPRLCRIMGIPPSTTNADLFRADGGYKLVTDAAYGFRWAWDIDSRTAVNYFDVRGVSYRRDDGTAEDVRSFPLQMATLGWLPQEAGVRFEGYSSNFLYSDQAATGARQIRESDRGGMVITAGIELHGMPTAYPGHIHRLVSTGAGLDSWYRVMTVRHRWDASSGFRTRIDYRRGAGTPQPAGADRCTVLALSPTTARHVGDEYVAHYVQPSPLGTSVSYTFTPATAWESLTVLGRAHGMNSQLRLPGGGNVDLTASKVELLQNGEVVGSATLPVMDENLAEARPYSNDANWDDFSVGITGALVPGLVATLRFVSGSGDDFEVKNVRIQRCEEGQPLPPSYPRPPTTPLPPRTPPGQTAPGAGTTPLGGTAPARPDRPARLSLLRDGTARPGAPALATVTGYAVGQGRTVMTASGEFTNLTALSGTYGAGMREYAQLRLRRADGVVQTFRSQLVRLPADGGGVAAGSGPRNISWSLGSFLSGQAATIDPTATGIYSETNTVGVVRLTASGVA